MILMIDNYDSFTFNLVQYLRQLGAQIDVHRNDALSLSDIDTMKPKGIVISPGPGRPEFAGISVSIINHFSGKIPILGVCLGLQSIAYAFGGKIISANKIMHGKTSMITADSQKLYQGIDKPFTAMRYHSLAVSRNELPDCLQISAESEDGEIMGLRHMEHTTEGVQFHPESIMTTIGKRLLRNFINITEIQEKVKE